jgi:predicted restriction endonuclease
MRNFKDINYVNWRKEIYKRDNHQCQWPGCNTRKKLNAHHIKKWSDYPGLRFHTSNGITLCRNHHQLIKDNEENYEQFFFKIVSSKQNEKQ